MPLYTMADAERTLPLFRPVPVSPAAHSGSDSLTYEAYDAGHILGSSCVVLHDASDGRACAWPSPATSAARTCPSFAIPSRMPPADYLIMESTYGGRLHKSVEHVINKLADVVQPHRPRAAAASSCRRSPWAARSSSCCCSTSWPTRSASPTFRSSWTARWPSNVTAVHPRPPRVLRRRDPRVPGPRRGPLRFPAPAVRPRGRRIQEAERPARAVRGHFRLGHVRAGPHSAPPAQQYRGSAQHRADHRLPGAGHARPQARGEVAGGAIFGEPMRVRAEISSLDELSGHADQSELLEWIRPMAPQPAQGLPGARRAPAIRDVRPAAARARYDLEVVSRRRARVSIWISRNRKSPRPIYTVEGS